ncbi:hypothetical protein [Amycolatopsis sp. MJM2582]|uniref:hypothetical protein n=1 Tax=Amycolatopsis sp. MJM2582 TaxID=1427749 RepID=UPI00350F33E4
MLVEAETTLDELESLIQRINRTNAATPDHNSAQQGAQVTAQTALFITTCRSRRVRAGTGVFPRIPGVTVVFPTLFTQPRHGRG